ncbi:hypothetical protein ANOM_011014 [Aspergillus nomiae NRRL 13137]|uniref:Peptidase C14 caspase domain-containing protein n=1 Tax=Aspergillus nomiae NRRL (strain ATCC 15546 / NRRL 13137 / CBS 260.88 / M93) TaxID=1509407 RepID=A0A0L1INF7_ASPN3|nr:uncharacterized protein ANOM_011014 [Aspergillus nomiae NRRL 13137]KNG80860.1 hypothetical protein ANOM_011014 [Aspergillus nomiae NRRL 13137]
MEVISADQTMNAITRAQFEDVITRAVNNHSQIYNNSFALSVRWERDKTNASADLDHFQAILRTLNLDQAEVEILAEHDQTPGWTLNESVRLIFRLAANAPGKSIVLIHYAGHGVVRGEQLFSVEGLSRRSINLQRIIDTVVAGDFQDFDIADTDAVFVLDCCYSYVAKRALNPTTRVVEILSASDDHTPEALKAPHNTLTEKLRGEIARRKRDGHHFVVFSDAMATIRGNSSVIKPTHHVKLGASVCFPFTGVTRINPSTIAPSLRAVFSVRIAEKMTREQLDRFLTWIEAFPPGFTMELDGVYITTSTLLIFQSAYALFTNHAGYPGVTFISDVRSPNRRQSLGQEQ